MRVTDITKIVRQLLVVDNCPCRPAPQLRIEKVASRMKENIFQREREREREIAKRKQNCEH